MTVSWEMTQVKVTQNVTNAGRACSLDFFRFVICQVHVGKEKVDDWRRNFSEESRGCRATRARIDDSNDSNSGSSRPCANANRSRGRISHQLSTPRYRTISLYTGIPPSAHINNRNVRHASHRVDVTGNAHITPLCHPTRPRAWHAAPSGDKFMICEPRVVM